jgi:tetratricopeptide (TPR) repeat protein
MIARALVVVVVVTLAQVSSPLRAAADDDSTGVREATKHFQRGVTLYGETDYRGALVEFNRAYAIAPNSAVLYNIGESHYQLRDYAAALTTFERYLATCGAGDSHRAELEGSVRELRSRVGRLMIATTPAGAEVGVDDRAVGKTPFETAVIVNIGRLKVSASLPGRAPVTTYVEVAAEDNLSIALDLPPTAPSAFPPAVTAKALPVDKIPGPGRDSQAADQSTLWRTAGWIATGTLAAGAITLALVARRESNDLKAARNQYPTSPTTLDQKANRTTTFAVLADSVAAAAIVIGGITLYSTLDAHRGASATRVTVGISSIDLTVTF